MKRFILLLFVLSAAVSCRKSHTSFTDYVDVFWGTGATEAPLSEGMARGWNWEKAQSGNTSPAAVLPYGWVSACAFTGAYSSGYGRVGYSSCLEPPVMYGDTLKAYGFSHFHHSGVGLMGRFYNYFLFTPGSRNADFSAPSALVNESARPGYYAAQLQDYGASFELAAGTYAACHRYAFPSGSGKLRIDLSHAGLGTDCFRPIRPHQQAEEIESVVVNSVCGNELAGTMRAYGKDIFFDIIAKGDAAVSDCNGAVVDLIFEGSTAETVIGFSLENAEEAAQRAGNAADMGFDACLRNAEQAWNLALGRIRTSFADDAQIRCFYSTLYHSMTKPAGYGAGYLDFATLWDMYRTALPLAFSLSDHGEGIARYLENSVSQYGYCPVSHTLQVEMDDHSGQASALGVYSLSDAFFRGLFTSGEYPELKKAFISDLAHYSDVRGKSPSHTLDMCGAYGAVAFVADACADESFAQVMRDSASIWKTVYDSADGLLRQDAVYYEGNRYNYSFRPHPGMNERVAMAGGNDAFCRLLDEFFCVKGNPDWDPEQDRIRRRDHFEGMNNECDMDTPYAYIWCGRPDRTAEVLDAVRRYRFTEGEGGCPGNNDSGSTSSWYVWSCLGIYPLTGTPYYLLGSPSVDSAELQFNGGVLKIKVERESPASIYPQWYKFNGIEFRSPWLKVEEMEKGGTLVFRLADSPAAEPAPVPDWL